MPRYTAVLDACVPEHMDVPDICTLPEPGALDTDVPIAVFIPAHAYFLFRLVRESGPYAGEGFKLTSIAPDASVLVPIALADTLLRVAEKGLYRPLWPMRILAEAQTATKEAHPGIDAGKRFAQAIITANVKDFHGAALEPLGLEAVHPDDFLLDQLDLSPPTVLQVIHEQAAHTRRPPLAPRDLATLQAGGRTARTCARRDRPSQIPQPVTTAP
jgi:hypothetical protein